MKSILLHEFALNEPYLISWSGVWLELVRLSQIMTNVQSKTLPPHFQNDFSLLPKQ